MSLAGGDGNNGSDGRMDLMLGKAGWQSAIQPGLVAKEARNMNGTDRQTGQCMARETRRCSKDLKDGRKPCARGWSRRGVTFCIPNIYEVADCLPTKCLIAHEAIHICGINHANSNNPGFACVEQFISGCKGWDK
ncbi:MAG: hypothetical protein ABL949_10125 [Fimbriimonadaceae bacterium]